MAGLRNNFLIILPDGAEVPKAPRQGAGQLRFRPRSTLNCRSLGKPWVERPHKRGQLVPAHRRCSARGSVRAPPALNPVPEENLVVLDVNPRPCCSPP